MSSLLRRAAGLSLVTAILVGEAVAARGGDPAVPGQPSRGEQRLEELIRQLGSPRYRIREAAAKELTDRPDTVPALERALKSPDPEVVHQAERILGRKREFQRRRALERAVAWGKAGRADLMIDALVMWDGPKDSEEYWQTVIDLAHHLIRPAEERYIKAHNRGLIVGDPDDCPFLRRVYKDLHGMNLEAILYRSGEVVDEDKRPGGDWVGYARCGRARFANYITASAVVASDSVALSGPRSSIILANGDVDICEAQHGIIIAGGTIRARESSPFFRLTGSLVVARKWEPHSKYNDFTHSVLLCAERYERPLKKVRFAVEKSIIEDGKPLDFFKWFDPIEVGVRVKEHDKELVIDRVAPGKPFARAGLKAGDVIVEVDGQKTDTAERFRGLLRKGVVREKAIVKFRRDGKAQEVTVPLPEIPEYLPPPRVGPAPGRPVPRRAGPVRKRRRPRPDRGA